MTIQGNYSINPEVGFVGMISDPNAPTYIQEGQLHLATGDNRSAGARPGDAVGWDSTNDAWRVAHTAATRILVSGILTYRQDDVASSNDQTRFHDGDQIFVVRMGIVWVTAGGAVEQDDQIEFQIDDFKYDLQARVTAIANMAAHPIVCYSRSGVNNAIVKAAIGYGRVI